MRPTALTKEAAGLVNVCVHKGLFPPHTEQEFPQLLAYSDVRDVGKAAKDWPQLNFVIHHSAYRFAAGGKVEDAWAQFEKTATATCCRLAVEARDPSASPSRRPPDPTVQ